MFFLDDFLELLEPFKEQFKSDIDQIGQLDVEANNFQRQMHEKSEEMFKSCERKVQQGVQNVQADPEITAMFNQVKQFKTKAKNAHEKKGKMITEVISKVDRYLRRCDGDLDLFKNEMENEQPGITNELESKALDDKPPELSLRKNSLLDYEYDEKQFRHTTSTPSRKKNSSHNRSRRPSEKDLQAADNTGLMRQTSLPDRGRKHSSSIRIDRSHSVGPPPAKAIRIDPVSLLSVDPGSIDGDGAVRPSRMKKLTPKGVQYRQTISSKQDQHFRVPLADNFSNGESGTSIPSTSTAVHFVRDVIPDNANSGNEISPFKTLQIHPGIININQVQE